MRSSARLKSALGIVREHDDVNTLHELRENVAQGRPPRARAIAQHPLESAVVACEHAKLMHGRQRRRAHELAAHAAVHEQRLEQLAALIRADDAGQNRLRAERRLSAQRWPRRPRAARRSASARRARVPPARSAQCRRTNIRRASRRRQASRGRARSQEIVNATRGRLGGAGAILALRSMRRRIEKRGPAHFIRGGPTAVRCRLKSVGGS